MTTREEIARLVDPRSFEMNEIHSTQMSRDAMERALDTADAILNLRSAATPDVRAVIAEMIEVATGDDDSVMAEWTSDNRAEIDKWQSRLQIALANQDAPTRDGDFVLPCDVSLSSPDTSLENPYLVLRQGCKLSTLISALNRRAALQQSPPQGGNEMSDKLYSIKFTKQQLWTLWQNYDAAFTEPAAKSEIETEISDKLGALYRKINRSKSPTEQSASGLRSPIDGERT